MYKYKKAFTVIELIVSIVIIGILAGITLIGLSNFSERAVIASIKSDLSSNAKKIKNYQAQYNTYPTSLNGYCPSAPSADKNYCLVVSPGNSVIGYVGTSNTFELQIKNGNLTYKITESSTPTVFNSISTFVYMYSGLSSTSMTKTSDGGFIVTGNNYPTISSSSIFISKFNSSAQHSWTKILSNPSSSTYSNCIIQTSDGGYAVTGSDGSSLFITKLDTNGNMTWYKQWGGVYGASGKKLIQTSDGGFAITGYFRDSITFYNQLLVMKFDSTGNLSWSNTYQTSIAYNSTTGNSIFQKSDGSYIVVGGHDSSSGMIVMNLSSTGAIIWSRNWLLYDHAEGIDVISNSDGSFTVTGTYTQNGSESDSIFSLLIRYDSTGNVIWSKSGPYGTSIRSTSDGSYIITSGYGNVYGTSSIQTSKIDSSGNSIWSKGFQYPNSQTVYYSSNTAVETSDGGFIVSGTSNEQNYSLLLVKYNSVGNIEKCTDLLMCFSLNSSTYTITGANVNVATTFIVTSRNLTLNSFSPTSSNYTPTLTVKVSP
jgi:prepilin-type N-terminal cleavage/methylation domain-containing protein